MFSADEAGAVLAWWADAGVGAPVDETPRNWLAPPVRVRRADPAAAAGEILPDPAPVALPATLDDFVRWRMEGDDAAEAGWGTPRIAPSAAAGAAAAVVVDMPEPGDADRLMEGDVGRLFDRMLAAIGLPREAVALTALAWSRPPGGSLDQAAAMRLAALTRHHLALLAPRAVLVMGHATTRALLGGELADLRGAPRPICDDPAGPLAIVTFHPRLLMQTPAAKAEAWRDLLLFKKDL